MNDVIQVALKEYATHDIAGPSSNPRVLQYFSDIGQSWVKDDDTAWCAAFLNWVLKQAGRQYPGSLAARSFLNYGSATDTPEIGDLVVLWRISPTSPYGHCGIFIREVDNLIYILGGNQADKVSIAAFPKSQLLSYRKI